MSRTTALRQILAALPEGTVIPEAAQADAVQAVQWVIERWKADIAERKRVEEVLRERNRYIDTILEEAPIGFAVHTIDDGVARFVSARYEQIYGVQRGEIDSHYTFFDKVWRHDPAFRRQIRERVVADMTSGDASRMHWENVPIRSATGEMRYISAMNIPLLDQNLMVSTVQDVTDRVRAEEARRESEALYRLVAENVSDLIWILDVEVRRFRYASPSVERLLGYTPEEVLERGWIAEMFQSESAQAALRALWDRAEAFERGMGEAYTDDLELTRRDGSTVWVEFVARFVRNEDTGRLEAYGVSRDISERRRAEVERQRLSAELFQAQKMESVGRLAGGIAHDFNNILADMTLQLGLASVRHPEAKTVFDELRTDAELAATLIRHLLAFSRRSAVDMRLVDLNGVVGNLTRMLARLLGASISLRFEPSREAAGVLADAGMLEQVIMNLAVNARDAMPDGGSLSIRISRAVVAEHDAGPRRHRGEFVRLAVSDTGSGMTPETLARAFEPFFTTKDPDKGTGLGLSVVHGIVERHGGWIEAASAPGEGSTFVVVLPAAGDVPAGEADRAAHTVLAGSETILLVDDFARLREKIADSLRSLGYDVIEAGSGEEAIEAWRRHHDRIDMLYSDIALPAGMNGLQLADRFRKDKPTLKVVLSSGYGDELVDEARTAAGTAFLSKPCGIEAMARTIRDCFEPPGVRC